MAGRVGWLEGWDGWPVGMAGRMGWDGWPGGMGGRVV